MAIRGGLVAFLRESNRFFDVRVKLIEVGNELAGPMGGDLFVEGHGDVRMVTFVREEGGNTSGIVDGVVVGELGDGKEGRPVVLLVRAEGTEDLFEGLVHTFSLSVHLRMISGGEVKFHI